MASGLPSTYHKSVILYETLYMQLNFAPGGGFGGKETRSTFLSSSIAVAAHK